MQNAQVLRLDALKRSVQHEEHHEDVLARAQIILAQHRIRLHIDPTWQVQLRVVCEHDMPNAYAMCRWSYLPNKTYLIQIRCDLSSDEMPWAIAHELLEALLAKYADFVETNLLGNITRNQALKDELTRQHSLLRDEAIEHLLIVLFGSERPARMP